MRRSILKGKTNDEFKKEVYDLVGGEYTFLDDYQGALIKIEVRHNKCGHTYEVQPNDFLNKGRRCPLCYGNIKKTDAQFKQEVFDLVEDEYVFLDHYVNAYTKIRVKHNKCGRVYKVRPNSFFEGRRCSYCANQIRYDKLVKTDTQFKQEVFALVGDEYVFLDSYINNGTKIRVKHHKCGNIYEVTPSHFIQGYRCPFCNISHGEDFINRILKSLGVNYEYQKTFDDLKDTQSLSYDFYIPDQSILIEYQGIQHYQPVDHFGGKTKFKLQQKHDKMKANYAKEHGYNLIAIPYTEDTFSRIKKYLIKNGLR